MPKFNKLDLDFIRIISYMLIPLLNFPIIVSAIDEKYFNDTSSLCSSLKFCCITSEACKQIHVT